MQEEIDRLARMAAKTRQADIMNQACALELAQRMQDAPPELRAKLIAHRKWLVGLKRGTVKAELVK